MAYRKRIYYTATQKVEMWDRWQQGETLKRLNRPDDHRRGVHMEGVPGLSDLNYLPHF